MKMKNGHVLEFEQEEIGGVEVGARRWGMKMLEALRRWEKRQGICPRFDAGWFRGSKHGKRGKRRERPGHA